MPTTPESFEKYILSSLIEGLIAVDRDGRYIHWNQTMERMTGLKTAAVMGRVAWEVFPFLREIGEDRLIRQALGGKTVTGERRPFSIPETGQSGFFEATYAPLKNDDGSVIGAVGIVRDVTELARETERLVESIGQKKGHERFRALVDNVQNIIWAADKTGRNIFTNQFGIDYVGLASDERDFDNWVPMLHPEDVDQVRAAWLAAFESGTSFEHQHRMRRAADGSFRWVIARAYPVRNPKNEIIEWIGTVTDIHEQVIASNRSMELQTISAALSSAVTPEQVADIFLSMGLKAVSGKNALIAIPAADRKNAEIFASRGYPAEIIAEWCEFPVNVDVPVTETITHRRPTYVRSLNQARTRYPLIVAAMEKGGEQSHASLPLIVKNEVIGVLSLGFAEPQDFDEDRERFMMTLAGLCAQAFERSRIYESETAARALAESANKAKSGFLATVSHEIRTPLSAIIGYCELLGKPEMQPEKLNVFVQGIERNSKALARLVDDLLDLSKVEAGQISVENVEFHVTSCVHEAIESLRPEAERKHLKFKFTRRDGVPGKITSDPYRLRQILLNIVGNAIKFTDSGSVDVVMSARDLPETGRRSLVFSVIDTGIGLRPEAQSILFQPFSQVHGPDDQRRTGTGLGLVISRKLARMMGGDVRLVSSSPNDGTVFEIEIADRQNSAAANRRGHRVATAPQKDALKGLRILVADDAPDIQVIVSNLLSAQGAIVETADHGQDAIEKALVTPFDLIIMDLQMPLVNGYEATSHLRDSGVACPIVALTANALGDVRKAIKSGFDAHLIKPVSTEILLQTVFDLAARQDASS